MRSGWGRRRFVALSIVAILTSTTTAGANQGQRLPADCGTFTSTIYGLNHEGVRCEAWVARFNDPVEEYDGAVRGNRATATSPDGTVLYVAGNSDIDPAVDDLDAVVVATDTTNGEQLWAARFAEEGDEKGWVLAYAMDVDPTGGAVYVLANARAVSGGPADSVLLSFDASTGALLWKAPLATPWGERGTFSSIEASPDGTRVYATGYAGFTNEAGKKLLSGVTAAFDTVGQQVWITRFVAPHGSFARHVSVGDDGTRVFVGGSILLPNGRREGFTTVAYDAGTGERLWQAHEPQPFPDDPGIPAMAGMAVSPNGDRVFVTGAAQISEQGSTSFQVIAVYAYSAVTGDKLWDSQVAGPYPTGGDGTRSGLFVEVGSPIAVSPDGSAVYVTGTLADIDPVAGGVRYAIVTAALNTTTGSELWRNEYDEGRPRRTFWPNLPALVVSQNQVFVAVTRSIEVVVPFVTAQYEDQYATLALDASTGVTQWEGRWGEGRSKPSGLAVTPDGSRVFVTGESLELAEKTEGSWDMVTVAYDTGP